VIIIDVGLPEICYDVVTFRFISSRAKHASSLSLFLHYNTQLMAVSKHDM